ncbi:hypothetical protein [Erythrobacter sp. BLCC-B19]|uniref:hypothetical protein n=1 Tax=Erythrobacter sp. BLCC-B19 TaxID=3025315 RepID=UPI0023601EBA|nr:hypothetical protein [Erythrobacter sp. BLCC-B19]WDA41385.1 hypothetical protein PS060_00840 [Erythrobacter sp. BLCC-B19]
MRGGVARETEDIGFHGPGCSGSRTGQHGTEPEARTEAMRAVTRLRIDAHDLWLAD